MNAGYWEAPFRALSYQIIEVIMKINRIKIAVVLALSCCFFMTSLSIAETPKAPAPKTQPLKGKTVNINKATEAEILKNVPLITGALAKKIVQYRNENGDFSTLEELLQIDGFTRDLLRRIKPFLLLEGFGGKDCTC
jgi:competence protein ComEA